MSGSEEEYIDENGKSVKVKKRNKKKSLDDAVRSVSSFQPVSLKWLFFFHSFENFKE